MIFNYLATTAIDERTLSEIYLATFSLFSSAADDKKSSKSTDNL